MVSKTVKALDALKQGVQGLSNYLSRLQGKKCNPYQVEKAREGLLRADAIIGVLSSRLPEKSKNSLGEVRQRQETNWDNYSKLHCED